MPDRSAHLFVRRACVRVASLGVLPLLGLFAGPAPVAAQVVSTTPPRPVWSSSGIAS